MTASNRSFGRALCATLHFFGAVSLGIALMTILAIVMGWATFLEREMGTPAAQYLVYASPWFYALIAALAFNLTCSALARIPKLVLRVDGKLRVNRALFPFFLAHVGVVLLIVGCLVTATKSSRARATIAEGTAAEKAIDVDSRLLSVRVLDFAANAKTDGAAPEPNATDVDIPFSGGPLNWRDQESAELWRADVADPILATKPETKFFNRLGKKASALSQRCAYLASRFARRARPSVLYDAGGLKIEALEYATCADYAPVPELTGSLVVRDRNGKDVAKKLTLAFPFEASVIGGDPLATTRKSQRTTLDDGIRVVYALAESSAESAAFARVVPEKGETNRAVLLVDGERFDLALDDLGKLAQYGDLENQALTLAVQREEIERRLRQEREYVENAEISAEPVEETTETAPTDETTQDEAPPTKDDATNPDDADSPSESESESEPEPQSAPEDRPEAAISAVAARYAQDADSGAAESKAARIKPLQATTPEALDEGDAKLRALGDKLAAAADSATDPEGRPGDGFDDYQTTLREFTRQRTLNYLAATWARLESVSKTSQELIDVLEKSLDETSRRAVEVEGLAERVKLGESGWRVLGFVMSPTQVQGVEELHGTTAAFTLESPQGEAVETTLFSELPERNRYPESGRVFGALWSAPTENEDNIYGRKWAENLGRPRLELMQGSDGTIQYRYAEPGFYAAGTLETSSLDETQGTFKAAPVAFDLGDAKASYDRLVSLTLDSFALQDELGARLLPTLFVKENATEFYGKLKLRVTLDDVSETFWLRTIPLESVDQAQIRYFTKTVASKTRRAEIRLTDREIDLGVALYVKKFTPTYEPGSSTPASFASLARVLPKETSPEERAEAVATDPEKDVLIEMNRPGVLKAPGSSKVYWAYQDSFRGPYKPGDKEFDDVVQGKLLPGESTPRDSLYYTIVALNDDPGRGLKYLACLFIVWGTALLVYRGRGAKTPKQDATSADDAAQSASSAPNSGKVSTTLLTALCFVAAFLAGIARPGLRGDEVDPDQEKRVAAARETYAREHIDWSAWRSLPVFDGGRRTPLNTFAQILVRDVTGAKWPVVVAPTTALERLEGDRPLNFPDFDEFLRDLGAEAKSAGKDADASREEQKEWYDDVAAKTVARQREVAEQIRLAFPNGKRRFAPSELLFSWLAEPELWESLPFILDEKSLVARQVLKLKEEEIAERNGRLAPQDFDALEHGSSKTLVEAYRVRPDADPDVLKALDKVEDRLANWRSVVFTPTQGASSRPRLYVNKILYGAMPAMSAAPHGAQTAPMTKLDDAARRLERLLSHEKRALRKTSPLYDKEHPLRQRAKLANDASGRDVLALARQVALLGEIYRRYPLSSSGVLFEKLLDSTSRTLEELREHRDAIMSERTFSLEYRQALEEAVSALDEIVGYLEQAALAITTEEPKALLVAPVVRARVFRTSESQDAPWVSLQTLLYSPDPLYARFVDPEERDKLLDHSSLPEDRNPVSPFDDALSALRKTRANQETSRPEVDAFLDAVEAYRDREADDRGGRVTAALETFADEMRKLAERGSETRETLAREIDDDDEAIVAYFAKTRYPDKGALDAEIFYYDLDAFYWNWIACACAVAAFLASYLRQGLRRIVGKKKDDGERFFFALGLLFLTLGCAVAFVGGATRAYVTGWAPVANMFETVVLLAFLIATIAIFYTLAPIWRRPYLDAWRASAFLYRGEDSGSRRAWRVMAPIRAILTLALIVGGAALRLGSLDVSSGALEALRRQVVDSVTMQGFLDAAAVLATFLFVVWLAPRFVATLLALLFFPKTFWRRDDLVVPPGRTRRQELVAQVVERRAFLMASATIAALVAAAAYFNSAEFNPNIRPLVAVLRSNFWLTIHVIAIIVSYALGAIAWAVSLVSLAHYAFGRYRNRESNLSIDPEYCERVAPVIATMLRSSALFLTAGIILGARWADFSWGRFWSWDPKEVWALVTLLVYLVVLHACRLGGRSRFALSFGATLGALAIIMTWYGLSFVMGGGGRHAYTGGESNKVAVLYILFAANILWALVALARYWVEKARRREKKAAGAK